MLPMKRKTSQSSPAKQVRPTYSPPQADTSSPLSLTMPTYGRPLSNAAAAAAAIKRSPSATNTSRRTSAGTPHLMSTPSSRQGSIDMDREDMPVQIEEDDSAPVDPNVPLSQPPQDAENEDDDENKDELVLDMDAHMQAQMEKAKEDMK
ncbi:hypothetical protein BDF14DRAFT_74673 [Spinellus fusiger]|nr:hypothetical protein BDF14DRAFT_74673 [Spinellus fusiger]